MSTSLLNPSEIGLGTVRKPLSLWQRLVRWLRPRDPEALDFAFVELVNTMPAPAALFDAQGRVRALSTALLAPGAPPLAPEIKNAWDALRARVSATGQGHVETIRQPGPPESVQVTSATPILGERGEVRFVLVTAVDISAGERARERCVSLEQEVRLLREVIDGIPHGVYAKDAKHRFVLANPAAARTILGAPDVELLLGKTDHDFLSKAEADRFCAEERQVMTSEQALIDVEERTTHKGKEIWHLVSKFPRRGPDGKVNGVVCLLRDSTARRQAALALEGERNLLLSLMDSTPDLIFCKDREGRFTLMNKAYANLIGLKDPAEAIGRPSAEVLGAERAQSSRREEEQIFRDGKPILNKEIVSPGGVNRWQLVSKVPVRDGLGQVTRVLGIARDITERKLREEALAHGLAEFLDVASAVSEGDLTCRGRVGEDILGRVGAALNRMLERFGEALVQVQELANAVSTSAAEIRIASDEIARGAQEQSAETLSVSASAEEIARSMSSMSHSAQDAAAMALEARDTAQKGDLLAREASEAMSRIERSVIQSLEKMQRHQRASEEILDVVETIKEFADQTNLLSLNASIEAARAGAAGAGFNVIAGVIRNLADKSAEAAKDVDGRITLMQAGTAEAVLAIEETTDAIRSGLELVAGSLQGLTAITTVVGGAVDRSGEISRAAEEQRQVTADLARRILTIAAIAGQTSAAAEESARTVAATSRMAEELRETLGRFRLK